MGLAWCRYVLTRISLSENVADIHKLAEQALADTDTISMGDANVKDKESECYAILANITASNLSLLDKYELEELYTLLVKAERAACLDSVTE